MKTHKRDDFDTFNEVEEDEIEFLVEFDLDFEDLDFEVDLDEESSLSFARISIILGG